MASAPTKHLLHLEIKFQTAFDTLCAAFWTQIESRQKHPTLTLAGTTEASGFVPTSCSSSRLRAKMSKYPTQPAPVESLLAELTHGGTLPDRDLADLT
ncbi:Hypothetical predicted protein [Pelobates cultripes]|uniref:Uncharacterized protein n=1 Tax=Pelobates cultripes TaxID=61616 RepID=A0AAD1RBY3_PELCU|nr:Hypothetical predicted protein [Pelobates cultripes]